MKRIVLISLLIFAAGFSSFAQKGQKFPKTVIKTLKGSDFNTADINNDGKPVIISFWALWCKNCIKELDNVSEVYEDWQEETGVKLYAVSIDDSRSTRKVAPFAGAHDWPFEVLLDANSDLKRAMNVGVIPFTCVLDGKGNIVYQHTGYKEGDEEHLYEIVKKLAKGEKITK
ncbi:MAG: TlpA family protein disulfide reductase [Bacteroidales bacterium]